MGRYLLVLLSLLVSSDAAAAGLHPLHGWSVFSDQNLTLRHPRAWTVQPAANGDLVISTGIDREFSLLTVGAADGVTRPDDADLIATVEKELRQQVPKLRRVRGPVDLEQDAAVTLLVWEAEGPRSDGKVEARVYQKLLPGSRIARLLVMAPKERLTPLADTYSELFISLAPETPKVLPPPKLDTAFLQGANLADRKVGTFANDRMALLLRREEGDFSGRLATAFGRYTLRFTATEDATTFQGTLSPEDGDTALPIEVSWGENAILLGTGDGLHQLDAVKEKE